MSDLDNCPESVSDHAVTRGKSYEHDVHGQVEVTGIWNGVQKIDSARHMDRNDTIIVRYSAEQAGEQIDELTDTLAEFLDATE